jgi:uncharacterized protein YpiB (UPF0302 family)
MKTMQVKTNQKKSDFMKWFLETHQLSKKEYTWLFNYLRSSDEMLDKVHFVDTFNENHKKRIVLHANCSNRPGYYEFYMNGIIGHDPEKTFHNIRRESEEHVYVCLHFKGKETCSEWNDVLEDSPEGFTGFEVAAQLILDQSFDNYRIMQLQKEIDKALDLGDKELFLKLTNELNTTYTK